MTKQSEHSAGYLENERPILVFLILGGGMSNQQAPLSKTISTFTTSNAVVRYQISDLGRAVTFYTGQLGFTLEQQAGPIATVARGDLHLLLSGPKSSGARPMPDGRKQEPGGWNRLVLYVDDLAAWTDKLRKAGVTVRNDVEKGPGGSQILIEDPDGNPIELHEPPR